MLEAGARKKIKENRKILEKEVGKVRLYNQHKKHAINNPGLGQIINADHQPPVSSILEARKMNQNSKLAEAMLEVATNSSPLDNNQIDAVHKYHGLKLPTVSVPKEIHYEFPSSKSADFRKLIATKISKDDVEGTLKAMIIGGMPRCKLNSDKNFKDFQNSSISKTRMDVYEKSLPDHSLKIVETWYKPLQSKGLMTETNLKNMTVWINNGGYKDQNDPIRKEISKLL